MRTAFDACTLLIFAALAGYPAGSGRIERPGPDQMVFLPQHPYMALGTLRDAEIDKGAFKTPTCRNVAQTAPYMHDGSIATLADVLKHYAAGGRHLSSGPHAGDGRANPYKSDLISRIDLSEQEQADIIAFLKTLTDHEFLQNPRFAKPAQLASPPSAEPAMQPAALRHRPSP